MLGLEKNESAVIAGPTAKCCAPLKCIALLTPPVKSLLNLLLSKDTGAKAEHVS